MERWRNVVARKAKSTGDKNGLTTLKDEIEARQKRLKEVADEAGFSQNATNWQRRVEWELQQVLKAIDKHQSEEDKALKELASLVWISIMDIEQALDKITAPYERNMLLETQKNLQYVKGQLESKADAGARGK
jgi:hypothetical protein